MTGIHYIWALFPALLFGLFIWSLLRPYFGYRGKEDSKNYFSQALFCTIALVLAIWIDGLESYNELLNYISSLVMDVSVLRWLLYPLVLVVMAFLHGLIFKRDNRVKPKKNSYNR